MRIAFLGDMALFGRNTIRNAAYKEMFNPIKDELKMCDYVVANLESPLTLQTKVVGGKSAYLKGDPQDIEVLKFLGITHVTLANNHMFDYGKKGLLDTIKILEENGISWYGAIDKKVILKDVFNRIELMGFCCYSTNGKGLETEGIFINVFDPIRVEKEIKTAVLEGLLPILSIHWGQEHTHYPNYDHVEVARKLCNDRRIIIHGHHPHVIQGIEKIGSSIIAYSLGNFCFDDVYTNKSKQPLIKLSKDNQEAFALIIEVMNNKVIDYEVIPFTFENSQYRIDETIIKKIEKWSISLNTPKSEYIQQRTDEISAYIEKRKKLRNLEWYLKRTNFESIKMILNSRNNLKRYNALIKSYIS